MLKVKSIRRDLIGLIVLASISLGVVSGAFALKSYFDALGAKEISSNTELTATTFLIEKSFLSARRAEKDFLLRKDAKYLGRHANIMATLSDEINRLDAGLNEHSEGQTNPNILILREAISNYTVDFQKLSEFNSALGLTADVGLEGELRTAVHGIEKALNKLDVPEMQIKMLMMRRHEKDLIMRGDQKYVDQLIARTSEFRQFPVTLYPSPAVRDSVLRLLKKYQTAFLTYAEMALNERETRKTVSANFALAEPVFEALKAEVAEHLATDLSRITQTSRWVLVGSIGLILIAAMVFLYRAITLARKISIPLQGTAVAIEELSEGKLDAVVPVSSYGEIIKITDAFQVFRKNILDNQALEEKTRNKELSEIARKQDEMRKTREAEEAELVKRQTELDVIAVRDKKIIAEISAVVAACAKGDFSQRLKTSDKEGVFAELCDGINQISEVTNSGLYEIKDVLVALSSGILTQRMSGEFSGVFDDIRITVDTTVESLTSIVTQIGNSSVAIGGSTSEIAAAASDLAVRTERNAATLEETAAAIQLLSASVTVTASVANDANVAVVDIKAEAERSNVIVENTVDAMQKIQQSSAKISKMINLIDGIAFQTNLLALNAGVEAARAGDAGKGFAVVASEVRALAARSAEAAKEIGAFIKDSEQQVKQGVTLVDQTGKALTSISSGISGISDRIEEIALSAREQSASISEISASASVLDRSTQQNAAMFEEATAANHILKSEAENLAEVISSFQIDEDDPEETSLQDTSVPQEFNSEWGAGEAQKQLAS